MISSIASVDSGLSFSGRFNARTPDSPSACTTRWRNVGVTGFDIARTVVGRRNDRQRAPGAARCLLRHGEQLSNLAEVCNERWQNTDSNDRNRAEAQREV
jgi:hypothetical protein